MQRRNEFVSTTVPMTAAIIFVGIPLFSLENDMFDGVLSSYASYIDDFEGQRLWNFDSAWYLQYYLNISIHHVHKIVGLSYLTISKIIQLLSLLLIVNECRTFSHRYLRLRPADAMSTATIAATFGIWHVLSSTVMTHFILFFAIGIFGVRLLIDRNALGQIIGLVLIAISVELKSLLVFLPTYAYVMAISIRQPTLCRELIPPPKVLIVFFVGVTYYLGINALASPSGYYEGYNAIKIPTGSDEVLKIFRALSVYRMYFVAPLGCVILSAFLMLIFRHKLQKRFMPPTDIGWSILVGALLWISAIFPYVILGKSAPIIDVGWASRHGLLLAFAHPILMVSIFKYLGYLVSQNQPNKRGSYIVSLSATLVICTQIISLEYGFLTKLNRQIFEKELSSELSKLHPPPPGLVSFRVRGQLPQPHIRYYEANFLFFRVYGEASWLVDLYGRRSEEDYRRLADDRAFAKMHVLQPKEGFIQSMPDINVAGYYGWENALRNVFGLTNSTFIQVDSWPESSRY